jgi:hypothetical protein
MKALRTLVVSAASLASVAASADAQNIQFQTQKPNPAVTAFGYYVGPFTGTLISDPTRPTIDLFCLDVMNQVQFGQKWTAVFTNLANGNLASTRHGAANVLNYKKAAWLTSQYAVTSTSQWGGIQAAVWNLFNPGNPNGGTNAGNTGHEAYWLAQANAFANSNAFNTFDYSRYTIVTDVNGIGQRVGGVQGFMTTTVTPEPETYLLMGTGLLALLGVAVARGRLV